MENLDFLKTKYNLHASPEVEKSAERTEKRTGEKVPLKPEVRIQNYLDRFKEIIERNNPDKREFGLNALKRLLHSKFVIKPEEIPESAFLLEQHIAREQGYGAVEITEEFKERKTVQIINNQTQSLDKWVDYLASPDVQYSDWAKYWTFRSILEIDKLEKKQDEQGRETASFQKREKNTVASFPPLNPRALAMTIGALRSRLEEKAKPKKERKPIENKSFKLNEPEFQELLSTEKFSKIYAQFLIEMPEYSTEGLEETRGKWIKYLKGSAADELVKSLEGYPLEWCTADYDTAQTQLQGGDFYVYYSIHESFPYEKIFMQTMETDPNISSPESAKKLCNKKNIFLNNMGENILYQTEFSKESKSYKLVQFTVGQLGFPEGATIDKIYTRARDLGLKLCPAEVGPHLRLNISEKIIFVLQ